MIADQYVAVFQLNFTNPYEISQEKDRDMIVIEFLTDDLQRYLNRSSRKLMKKCPK